MPRLYQKLGKILKCTSVKTQTLLQFSWLEIIVGFFFFFWFIFLAKPIIQFQLIKVVTTLNKWSSEFNCHLGWKWPTSTQTTKQLNQPWVHLYSLKSRGKMAATNTPLQPSVLDFLCPYMLMRSVEIKINKFPYAASEEEVIFSSAHRLALTAAPPPAGFQRRSCSDPQQPNITLAHWPEGGIQRW